MRIKWGRIILILVIIGMIIGGSIIYFTKEKDPEFTPEVFTITYTKNGYNYTYRQSAFILDHIKYVSLNDFYNVVAIDYPNYNVQVDNSKMTFISATGTSTYDYSHKQVLIDYKPDDEEFTVNNQVLTWDKGEIHAYIYEDELYFPLDTANLMLKDVKLRISFTRHVAKIRKVKK